LNSSCCCQVIFPLDFEKTEASQRFMKAVEGIIRERPDCMGPNSASAQAAAAAAALDTPLQTPGAAAGHDGLPPPINSNSSSSSSAFGAASQQQQRQQQQQQQQQGPPGIPPNLLLPHELQHAGSLRMHRSSTAMHYSRDPELLPFELNMLEAALGEAFSLLEAPNARKSVGRPSSANRGRFFCTEQQCNGITHFLMT
jgi:hypothetical protein